MLLEAWLLQAFYAVLGEAMVTLCSVLGHHLEHLSELML